MFPIPLRRESRVTGYWLAGNRKSYTYWLANAFVFFVRDNLVNTPKICTSTSQFFPCSIYVSMCRAPADRPACDSYYSESPMRYLHPLAGCPSIAARRQPLADASAAVFPSPLFLVASTPQPHGTPASQDRGPPLHVWMFVSLLACPLLSACMPACLPSATVNLAWGVLDGDCGLVWGFLSWRGGLAGGVGDAHSGVGSPIGVFDPVAVAPPARLLGP